MSTSNTVPTNIPFLDLVTPHIELEPELTHVFHRVLNTAGFIGGPMVEEFEEAFAAFCGVDYSVGVSSGTDALRFAIMACGVQAGDVVLTVPHTFIATTEAISQAGAVPEFVDIDERTYNMSVEFLQEHLEKRCKREKSGRLVSLRSGRNVTAVVPVHLYGQMADMDEILKLSEEYGLTVIEDACQAHGAEYFSKKKNSWVKAGSMGRAAAFSFYPGKNLGACGEAGAVTTNDHQIADSIQMVRNHGQMTKYYHDVEGYNGRLDALQAGILGLKLKSLVGRNLQRRECAEIYRELFSFIEGVTLPYEPQWSRAVYHLFVIRIRDREGLRRHLANFNIGSGIHYPVPLHLQKAYQQIGYRHGDLPVTEKIASEILSLPMYPHLSRTDQESVVDRVIEHLCAEKLSVSSCDSEPRSREASIAVAV